MQEPPADSTQHCRIRVFDVAKETGVRLHPAHTPCRWKEHQFATEWWMDRHMRTSAADVASADLVYLTHHSFSLWCQRQQSVAVDHLRSPKLAKRLNARACLEGAEPASLPPAVHSLPPLNGSAQPLTPERLVPCSPTSKEALWQRVWAHPTIAAAVAASVPVVLTLTNNECGAPWGRREPPRGLLLQMTQDRTRRPRVPRRRPRDCRR